MSIDVMRQLLFAGTKSNQKVPFVQRAQAGAVLGVPDAENLKIRPEFFP
ncbi:hypothetical protein KW426_19055 [Vibrio fluvialis]|nr:hypothetical protein [Vibrio fluvialis]EKO3386531.1 hypothetical protein [Vibrio fluvialis]MBY7766605.1 hypothetical protein [Vibrio fluvialis]MBY7775218.1 hypothetical protein [Vibrio fluvialis]MBY7779521.1 hypothetical protein [Vibrio fluvialis]MBY7920900.1 hypothetical protein [Vibrio fluvialis]